MDATYLLQERNTAKTKQVKLNDLSETLGQDVYVTVSTVKGIVRDEYELYMSQQATQHYRPMWAAMCIVDENGKQIFKKEQMNEVGEKFTIAELDKIQQAAFEVNGISEQARKEIKNE